MHVSEPSPERAKQLGLAALLSGCSIALGLLVEYRPFTMLVLIGVALATTWWPNKLLASAHRLALLCSLAVIILTSGVKDDALDLLDGEVRVWNVYHYYLGAKYFPELGYTDLYLATLAADREEANYWTKEVEKIRSLETYRVARISRQDLAYDPSAHFSPERWDLFKADVTALAHHRKPRAWRNVFRDRGYNGTPFWTTLGRLLTAWIPAASPWLLLLACLDLGLLLGTGVLVYQTFGGLRSTLVLLLFAASPANVARLVGGFLQTDWLCAIVASICFMQRRRPVLAGALMAYALLTRAFPLVLVGCAAAALFANWLQGEDRSMIALLRRSSFYVALGLASILGLAVGSLGNGRGFDGWIEFKEAISVHREIHVIGDRRIGMEHFFTQDLAELGEKVSDRRRAELVGTQHPFYLVATSTLLILLAGVAIRRTELDLMLLGIVAVFCLLVLSRYYFGTLALLPLLSVNNRVNLRVVVGGQLLAFALYNWIVHGGSDLHTAYALLNGLLAAYFLFLLVLLVRTASPALTASELRQELKPS